MHFAISYELTGLGWAKCQITGSDGLCTVTASYLSNALGSLVIAATAVQSGFSRATFSFEVEPGEYRWVITSPRTNEVQLSISEFNSAYNEEPDERGKLLFQTRCRPVVFAEAVSAAARRVFSQHGESGYNEKWSEHPFPTMQLVELDRLLDGRRDA